MSKPEYLFGVRLVLLCLLCSPPFLAAQDSIGGKSGGDTTSIVTDSEGDTLSFDEFIDSVTTSRFVYDSSNPVRRTISEADLEDYRSDEEFNYARTKEPPKNILQKIFNWMFDLLEGIFGNRVAGQTFSYIFFGIALVLVVWMIMRGEGGGLFMRRGSKKGGVDFEEVPEDIHELDFEQLIASALSAGDFRKAVRLQYLKSLRTMSEHGLIEWRREKTNGEYLQEIREDRLRSGFARLTFLFDYVWYGGFQIDHQQYGGIENSFDSFVRQVEGKG